VHIPKNIELAKPIEIVHINTGNDNSLMLQPRNLIIVEKSSKVEIIESHYSIEKNGALTNSLTEIFVEENAFLDYYKVQNDSIKASLIDNTHVQQETNSNVHVGTYTFGGKLVRNNLHFYAGGEHTVLPHAQAGASPLGGCVPSKFGSA